MSTAADIQQITQRLQRMKPSEVSEIRDFVEFVARKSAPDVPKRRILRLKGVWKGTGLERLDVEKELKEVRKNLGEKILKRSETWNT